MKKFKFILNFEKEEKWLDKMAEQGYILEKKSFLYHFKSEDSTNVTFKIDYRKFKNNQDFIDYGMIFEDSGWKHVAGSKSSGFQYLKKINNDSDDDIFSDARSRAGRYKRISNMWLSFELMFTALFIVMLSQCKISIPALLSPKDWYLTPGLWEMDGVSFLWSFLFETPFALFRGCSWLIYIIFIILYGIFALKSTRMYERCINKE